MSFDTQTIWLQGSRYLNLFGQRLQNDPRFNERLSLLVSVILIMVIAWTLARLSWQWFYTPELETSIPVFNTTGQSQRKTTAPLEGVSALHLFGKVDSKANTLLTPVDAPDTQLRLVLSGVFAATAPEISIAIIAQKGQKAKNYHVGDVLPGNVKLHQVYTDRVIISRGGKLETLRINKKKNNLIQSVGVKTRTLPRASNTIRRPPSSRIKKVKKMFKSSPQELWKRIRITPVMKNGKISGYNFNHNDKNLMRDIGLKPTDVITAINGQPVTNMNTMMATMNKLDSMNELNLDFMRNGIAQSVSINLN
jgi:general secretion pathway protein C